MKKILAEIFTDALNRPEIKMILGVPLFFVSVGYLLMTKDLAVFSALMGTTLTLIGITAAGDAVIDKSRKGAE